ncbi:MAG: CoA-binding protein [Acetobacteraceae bacterium]|nr:CoA-binding protein [Acetobacteraceae bacterium]
MSIDGLADSDILSILRGTQRVAVVGASAKPDRASFYVAAFLAQQGITVIPVNPGLAGQSLHGQAAVASLAEAAPLDMVYIFRAADAAGAVVDEAIALGAKTIWLPLDVINHQAAARGRAAGLQVAMDRCAKVEWMRLGLPA